MERYTQIRIGSHLRRLSPELSIKVREEGFRNPCSRIENNDNQQLLEENLRQLKSELSKVALILKLLLSPLLIRL